MNSVTHSYNLPFSYLYKKIGIGCLVIGLLLLLYRKDIALIIINISFFFINFSSEKLENNRIFKVRYQTLKTTMITLSILLISLSILSSINPNNPISSLNSIWILLMVNLLYFFFFFQFYRFKIKE